MAESFLPAVHGVTHSVLRAIEHLSRRGREPVVIAPGPGAVEGGHRAIERSVAAPIVWLPAVGRRLRARFGPPDVAAVGYVVRLAAEKQLEDLAVLHDLDGVRLVIVGDGPYRARLERLLPNALFLGLQGGTHLAACMASLDIGVHPGEHETFGQAVQEKLASGVPVVAVAAGGMLDLVHTASTACTTVPVTWPASGTGSRPW